MAVTEERALTAAAEALLKGEAFGALHLDMTEKEVVAVLGPPSKKGKAAEEGATGEWIATWEWAKAGVEAVVTDAKKKPVVRSLELRAACGFKTRRGVGIGSTPAEVDAAYHAVRGSSNEHMYRVGGPYYGMVFEFKAGKVASIFWGPLGE